MKTAWIVATVVGVAALASGLGVLIWWLVTDGPESGEGFGDVKFTAAFTRIEGAGSMFWVFYPSEATEPTTRPILLWLDGVTGLPPSLLANFAMFGPIDFNLNKRNGSWVDNFNLLFVDAPLGTGFSTADNDDALPTNVDQNADHLLVALQDFYNKHSEYQESPLYIFGQGDGAKLSLSTAIKIANQQATFTSNLKGVVLGNSVISPASNLKQLGFYLSEMGYVDPQGREVVELFTTQLNLLVNAGNMGAAFDKFLSLGDFINEEAGSVAVNLRHLIQRLTKTSSRGSDYFNQKLYVRSALQLDNDFEDFMVKVAAPRLGISSPVFDQRRQAAVNAVRNTYMESAVSMVEYILQNTDLNVTIYNGNLDAVSTTPGQLDWVNNLNWAGIQDFKSGSRQALVVNSLLHGYFRETNRLAFYWINAAGISAPLDSPEAMRRVIMRCCGNL